MSELVNNSQQDINRFDAEIDAARARKKGAILFNGLDKQAGLTPTGVSELADIEADVQAANAEEGVQDPLSHLTDDQKKAYSDEKYAAQDVAARSGLDQDRVDAIMANIDNKYSVK